MKRGVILGLILVLLTSSISLAETTEKEVEVSVTDMVTQRVEKHIEEKGSITLIEIAEIITEEREVTYENYEYYRSKIKDTANRDILKLYSEGIIQGNGLGNMKADRQLSEEEITSIISRIDNPLVPERPQYIERKNIPILMYHEVNPLPKNGPTGLYVHPKKFIEQLEIIEKEGYNTVSMEQVYQHWQNKVALPEKPIVFSFDDGYISHFDFAAKEMGKRGMVGTYYLITGNINEVSGVTSEMVREMYKVGMEVGSHTVNHIDARYVNNSKILEEYKTSKETLERVLGVEIEHFCYPIGGTTQYAIEVLKDLGYKTSVVTKYGKANETQGLLTLRRIRVDYNDSSKGFLNKIK